MSPVFRKLKTFASDPSSVWNPFSLRSLTPSGTCCLSHVAPPLPPTTALSSRNPPPKTNTATSSMPTAKTQSDPPDLWYCARRRLLNQYFPPCLWYTSSIGSGTGPQNPALPSDQAERSCSLLTL